MLQLLKAPFCFSPVRKAARACLRKRVTILMYHGITESPLPVGNWCHMPRAQFHEEIETLHSLHRILPLPEVIARIGNDRSLPDHTACITFDDAFRNLMLTTHPILDRLQLPYTVFVATGLADTGEPPWPERLFAAIASTRRDSISTGNTLLGISDAASREKAFSAIFRALRQVPVQEKNEMLTGLLRELGDDPTAPDPRFATMRWADIAELARNELIHFGAHSETHEILTNCTEEQARREIVGSHDKLRERVGYALLFAYPNGNYNLQVKNLVRDAGFRAAVTTRHGTNARNADPYELQRIGIGSGTSLQRFETKLLGL